MNPRTNGYEGGGNLDFGRFGPQGRLMSWCRAPCRRLLTSLRTTHDSTTHGSPGAASMVPGWLPTGGDRLVMLRTDVDPGQSPEACWLSRDGCIGPRARRMILSREHGWPVVATTRRKYFRNA